MGTQHREIGISLRGHPFHSIGHDLPDIVIIGHRIGFVTNLKIEHPALANGPAVSLM